MSWFVMPECRFIFPEAGTCQSPEKKLYTAPRKNGIRVSFQKVWYGPNFHHGCVQAVGLGVPGLRCCFGRGHFPGAGACRSLPQSVFVAGDFRFEGTEILTGGLVRLQLHNHGTTLHHLQLLRLSKGKTPEDFFRALEARPGEFPGWSHFVGGPNAAIPRAVVHSHA